MVFFGAYVAVVHQGACPSRPIPFVVSFTGSFIALHLIEALALRRLFATLETLTMFVQEIAQEHAAAAVEGHAGKFDAGETIIHHVANSPLDEPLIHLPKVMGIDFSVTKHVFMLWLVAVTLFVVMTWAVRRYLKQDRLIPTG